jgi:hypothetical protein
LSPIYLGPKNLLCNRLGKSNWRTKKNNQEYWRKAPKTTFCTCTCLCVDAMLACRLYLIHIRGESRGAHAALKLEKIWFFVIKSWFFTWNTPTIFAPSSGIGKKYDFLAWNRDFSHEIPQKCSHLPPLGTIFLNAPTLTWNPGSAPAYYILCYVTVFIRPQISLLITQLKKSPLKTKC